MNGIGFISLAILILLMLPIITLRLEGRSVSHMLLGVIAVGGVIFSTLQGGMWGAVQSIAAAFFCVFATASIVALLRKKAQFILLSGYQMKLLGAGATWLGLKGSISMLFITFLMIFVFSVLSILKHQSRRPDASLIASFSTLAILMQQVVMST